MRHELLSNTWTMLQMRVERYGIVSTRCVPRTGEESPSAGMRRMLWKRAVDGRGQQVKEN